MKKYFTLLSLVMLIATSALAQQNPPRMGNEPPPPPGKEPSQNQRERVEALKVGFITERLNLTPEEAKLFWPLYNNFVDELEQLRKSRRENLNDGRANIDQMTDKEVEKTVDAELGFRQSEMDLIKKYHPEFKKVLPIKKVAKLYRAEEDFKRKLLEMIQDRRQEKRERIPREH